jgi:hypothetical protein
VRGKKEAPSGIVWQQDLRRVYLDPHRPPAKHDMLAYIPEQHASANCRRALPSGGYVPADQAGPWCDLCTCTSRADATIRRTVTGWKQVA